MKYAKVQSKHPNIEKPLEYGWLLRIDCLEELLTFFLEKDWVIKSAFQDEWCAITRNRHFTHPINWAHELLHGKEGCGYVDFLGKLNGKRFEAMANNLPVYVNRVGGWMPVAGCKELDFVEGDKWPVMEDEKPRYIKWPEAKHWYVKVGNMDVEVDGQVKWNTKEAAERAYEKWKTTKK